MEKDLTTQKSLSIINEMILQARNNFQQKSATKSIIAGYCVAAVALLNFALLFILPHPQYSFHIWWLMIPMSIVLTVIDRKNDRKKIVKTHIDSVIGKMWGAFGYSVIATLLVIFVSVFTFQSWTITAIITPSILILTGLAQYTTGAAFRFRPYTYGGIVFWIGALLTVGTYCIGKSEIQFIILALCMILGFVIPGYKANKKGE